METHFHHIHGAETGILMVYFILSFLKSNPKLIKKLKDLTKKLKDLTKSSKT